MIWVTSACEPAKLYVTDNPGSLAPNTAFSSLNASVNDAAANTFSDPLSFAVDEGVGADGLLLLPHAATTSAKLTQIDPA